jgi:hypothetical protein
METETNLGLNKTGVQMSPKDISRMMEAIENDAEVSTDGAGIAAIRTSYIAEADPVGTIPMPGTMKGMVKTGAKKVTGKQPEVFMNKLGERLAFERSGARLYDALITKYQALPEPLEEVSRDKLLEIRNEEVQHFELVAKAIEALGGDPTAQTPDADITGVEAMGWMQVLGDPRTTFAQCLHAVLVAELADNAGWELLIALAEDMGQKQMVQDFREAFAHEQEHLEQVMTWHDQCVRAELVG